MRPLTLATKFNLLMAAAFSTIFLANIATLADRAHAGFKAEMRGNLKLARELVIMEIANNGDPVRRLRQVFDDPDYRQRVHFRVFWSGPPGREPTEAPEAAEKTLESPSWFTALVAPAPEVIRIPVTVEGMMKFGVIELTFHPDLEAGKAWSSLARLTLSSFGTLGAIFVAVLFFMHRWLYPFKPLGETLLALQRGQTHVRMEPQGAAEFRDTAGKINSLAATLERVEAENDELVEKLVRMQDDERARIARDLHDDVAPCLFAIRTGAATLSQRIATDANKKLLADITEAGAALSQIIRRLLDELRPPGLFEMGLEPALRSLIANWRATRPDVDVELETPHDLTAMDEAVALTAYRIVQEALTNIYRHASAHNAKVTLRFEDAAALDAETDAALLLHIVVSDDGVGFGPERNKGRGLVGMAERVRALKGRLDIRGAREGGAVVDAVLPLAVRPEFAEETRLALSNFA